MLKKKMFRDIKSNLSQFITIFLMVLIGILAFTGIEAYMDGMQKTSDIFYKENNLQDLNVSGIFNSNDLDKIKEIDNISDAELKLSVTASGGDTTLLLNVIDTNNISKFYICKGEEFKNENGVWLDNFYAKENNIHVGDNIEIKYDNITLEEEVKGLINVPDHIYDIKDESELYPNHKDFGFAYIASSELPKEYQNIYNTIMVTLKDSSKKDETKENIENNIVNVVAVTNIEDSLSYRTYQGEIDEGKTYVGVFSGLFIFIAFLSVITTMTRVVKKQRVQIGTLKALGFSDKKIALHYVSYGFFISLLGSIFGIILGYFLIGNVFINMEMQFFEIPNGRPVLNLLDFVVVILTIMGVSLVTYMSCYKITKESPSETLRPLMPKVKKHSLDITTKGIFKKMSFSSRWNLRDVFRNKIRTIMGIVGVTSSCMMILCAIGMLNSMNHFIELQFDTLYNFDNKLSLKENITTDELDNLISEYGNSTSESLGIEIKIDDKKVSNNAFVTSAGEMVRFVDKKDNFIKIDNNDGVYVTYKLASKYNLSLGDYITWHIYGSEKYYTSKIVGFNKDPQNQNITMTRNYLDSLGVNYKPDSLYTNSDLSNTKEISGVEVIQNIESLKNSMNSMLEIMNSMICLIIFIAIILGSVIIYNLGILSYTEKQYQFATLKVLGFNDKKIKKIFIKQNNWIAIISVILGLPLGYYLTDIIFKFAIEEHYDFAANIKWSTYLIAGICIFTLSYAVSMFLSKKINNIDMVTSLKGNE